MFGHKMPVRSSSTDEAFQKAYDMYKLIEQGTITVEQFRSLKANSNDWHIYFFAAACINYPDLITKLYKEMSNELYQGMSYEKITQILARLPEDDAERITTEQWMNCQSKDFSVIMEVAKKYFTITNKDGASVRKFKQEMVTSLAQSTKPKITNVSALLQDLSSQLKFIHSAEEVKTDFKPPLPKEITDPILARVLGVCLLYNLPNRRLKQIDYAAAQLYLKRAVKLGDHYAPYYCYLMAKDGLGYADAKNDKEVGKYLDKMCQSKLPEMVDLFKKEIKDFKPEQLTYAQALMLAEDKEDETLIDKGILALNRLIVHQPKENKKAYWQALIELMLYVINNKVKAETLGLSEASFYADALFNEKNLLLQEMDELAEAADNFYKTKKTDYRGQLKNAREVIKLAEEQLKAEKIAAEQAAKREAEALVAKQLEEKNAAERADQALKTKQKAEEQKAEEDKLSEALKKLRIDTLQKIDDAYEAIKPFLFQGIDIPEQTFAAHASMLKLCRKDFNSLNAEQQSRLASMLEVYHMYKPSYFPSYRPFDLSTLQTKGHCFAIISSFWRKGKFHATNADCPSVLSAFLWLESGRVAGFDEKDRLQIKLGFDKALDRYLNSTSLRHGKERRLLGRFMQALRTGKFDKDKLFGNVSAERMKTVQEVLIANCKNLGDSFPDDRWLKLLELMEKHIYLEKRHNLFWKSSTTMVTPELEGELKKVREKEKAKKKLGEMTPVAVVAAPVLPAAKITTTEMLPVRTSGQAQFYPSLEPASTSEHTHENVPEVVFPPPMNPAVIPAQREGVPAMVQSSGSLTMFAPPTAVVSSAVPKIRLMSPAAATQRFLESTVPTVNHAPVPSAPPPQEDVESTVGLGAAAPSRRLVSVANSG